MLNLLNQNNSDFKFSTNSFMTLLLGADLSNASNNTSSHNAESANKNSMSFSESKNGDLEIIYAEDGDSKYDESMDSDSDSRISYKEYLRYCEQNAKTEEKLSDTRINTNKSQFMTYSFGHAHNAYNKVEREVPEGKVVSEV